MSQCKHGLDRWKICHLCRIDKQFGTTTTGGEASHKKGKGADAE